MAERLKAMATKKRPHGGPRTGKRETAATRERKRLFAAAYIVNLNATDAAQAAGFKGDRHVLAVRGREMLLDEDVQALIQTEMEARNERVRIDADWLLRRLADKAEADLADLYDEAGGLKPVKDWPAVWRKGLVAGVETVGAGTAGVITKVRLADRTKIEELLGKHVDVRAFAERHEHSGPRGAPIEIKQAGPDLSKLSSDELRQMETLLSKCEADDAASGTGGS